MNYHLLNLKENYNFIVRSKKKKIINLNTEYYHISRSHSYMPSPEIYEKEYRFWPWGKLVNLVAGWIESNAQKLDVVVDYMCGTGYLLNEIASRRKDLKISGCSITPTFIEYAKKAYPRIDVVLQDAFEYKPKLLPDIVICTGGLHHLKRTLQPKFLEKIASELSTGKLFLLGEELIKHYNNENERRIAVIEMVETLISYVERQKAPREVVQVA
ncbi:hypothetical protein ES703_104495 [subsurface metagenome]